MSITGFGGEIVVITTLLVVSLTAVFIDAFTKREEPETKTP